MAGPGPYYQPGGWPPSPPPRHRPWLFIGIAIAFVAVAALILGYVLYTASTGAPSSPYPYRFAFGGVFFLFFILLVAFFIVRVAFWGSRAARYGAGYGRGHPPGYGRNGPAMVARMRYARGEITREQFDQIMTDLGRRPPPP